jgi:hypothetical protein
MMDSSERRVLRACHRNGGASYEPWLFVFWLSLSHWVPPPEVSVRAVVVVEVLPHLEPVG